MFQKPLGCTLTKSVKNISKSNQWKSTKEQLKTIKTIKIDKVKFELRN